LNASEKHSARIAELPLDGLLDRVRDAAAIAAGRAMPDQAQTCGESLRR
jgi:hypothetical protein